MSLSETANTISIQKISTMRQILLILIVFSFIYSPPSIHFRDLPHTYYILFFGNLQDNDIRTRSGKCYFKGKKEPFDGNVFLRKCVFLTNMVNDISKMI